MKAGLLVFAVCVTAFVLGCEPDPCAELVRHCCGTHDECSDGQACQSAQRIRLDGVLYACAEALDAPLSFPACRYK